MSVLYVIYIIEVKPFTIPLMNKLEVFNEICVIVCCYCLLMLSDMVADGVIRFNIGWFLLAMVALIIFVNVIVLVKETYKVVKKKV